MALVQKPLATQIERARVHSAIMIWLAATMVVISVLTLLALLGFLLWFGGEWFLHSGELPADSSILERLSYNWRYLMFDASSIRGVAGPGTGGILPAIVGTALMVLLMSVLVAPLGVVVAIYLSEYARDSWYTDLVRIAVQNLAGVPSIIYGVFGLAFFVYILGGQIDTVFYTDKLPAPTFGTPGLLWASLTLALLTLPVVIVSAEEGLSRLPTAMREGSYALGATRAETIFRILLPAASPSIVTGIILAVARAAGEVAPLMLVGVVKYAPTLPISLQAPFIHLEQKFMHLGFYIYDLTLHANLGEGRLALVCAVSLLLVLVITFLNLAAMLLRKRLRDRYQQVVEV